MKSADYLSEPHTNCTSDLVVFSHLRWDFVYQRPQHIMSRQARSRRVYFVEEPKPTNFDFSYLRYFEKSDGLRIVVPYLPRDLDATTAIEEQSLLLNELFEREIISDYTFWYYTPMALPFTSHLKPDVIIYDCMDELSHFQGAPVEIVDYEKKLLKKADVVFTGGRSLYEAKRHLHNNIHPFPSSIDAAHFKQARTLESEPVDQRCIPRIRLGFFGVIDERMDIDLIDGIASLKPDWNLILLGPVVKIDEKTLPRRSNIHYLGMKDYKTLPYYLSGWDVAVLPFARNKSTRFISPTKTPEYLAAGRPVVSTSIVDVVRTYARENLVYIADTPTEFVKCAELAMQDAKNPKWVQRVDEFLSQMSWENTCDQMTKLETRARTQKFQRQPLLLTGPRPQAGA